MLRYCFIIKLHLMDSAEQQPRVISGSVEEFLI